jgi:hypothetical protein
MKTYSTLLTALLGLLASLAAAAPLPHLVEKDGRFALFVDDAPFLVLGIEDLTMGDWPIRANVWNALEGSRWRPIDSRENLPRHLLTSSSQVINK